LKDADDYELGRRSIVAFDTLKASIAAEKSAVAAKVVSVQKRLQDFANEKQKLGPGSGITLRLPCSQILDHKPAGPNESRAEVGFPIADLVQQAMASVKPSTRQLLREHWDRRQNLYRHVMSDPIGKIPKQFTSVPLCRLAGTCLHNEPDLAAMEVAFVLKVTEMFKANTFERHLLTHGCIVFRLSIQGLEQEWWFHASYTNLAAGAWRLGLLRLHVDTEEGRMLDVVPGIALCVSGHSEWQMSWAALRCLSRFDLKCSAEVFRLWGSTLVVGPGTFDPSRLQVRQYLPEVSLSKTVFGVVCVFVCECVLSAPLQT
jgi:hypothetical protein